MDEGVCGMVVIDLSCMPGLACSGVVPRLVCVPL